MEEAVRLAPMGLIFHWALGNHYALVGRFPDAEREAAWLAEHAAEFPYAAQLRAPLAAVPGRHAEGLEILSLVDESSLDGHHTFHMAESYSMAGAHDRAAFLLDRAVTLGFYPHEYFARRCPLYEALRHRDDFAVVVSRSAARTNSLHAAMTSFVA